ncbi:MAG: hypothetical protein JWN41_1275, partial [Thermoleophilia bacterium]|nr:hypothetical protein [Thermoleophilia bacterium]
AEAGGYVLTARDLSDESVDTA